MRRFLVVVCLFISSALFADQAFVLDTEGKSLALIDLGSGEVVKRLALFAEPHDLVRSPDGSRVVVLFRGQGEEEKDGKWKPRGKAAAQTVDAKSLEKVGTEQLGYEVGDVVFLKDGSALVLSPGHP